jgi:hypothetical protein
MDVMFLALSIQTIDTDRFTPVPNRWVSPGAVLDVTAKTNNQSPQPGNKLHALSLYWWSWRGV